MTGSQSSLLRGIPPLPSRYKVEKLLGDGAAGKVFLVRDEGRGGELLALKVLANQVAFDNLTMERFCSEIEASRELKHPNIIRAYDYVPLGETMAYTMEYVDGHDLSYVLRSNRKLGADEIISILRQLLDALEALHSKGIVHRDIKLENVMLAHDGNVKLSDLGLMKRLGEKAITQVGTLLGTAQYMPPEYVRHGEYGTSGDIYALGTLILELFAGRRRLQGKAAEEALNELIQSDFVVPFGLLEDVPRMYRPLIKKATAAEVTGRFRSAGEMRSALDELDRGPRLQPSLRHEVRSEHFGRSAQRNKGGVSPRRRMLNLVVLLGVVLGIALSILIVK